MRRLILEAFLTLPSSIRSKIMLPHALKSRPPSRTFKKWYRASQITVHVLYTLAYQMAHRKYQFMEVNTQRRAAGLKDKIPDIQKTLDTVRFLETRKVRCSCRTHVNSHAELLCGCIARIRADWDDIRIEWYIVCKSASSTNRGGLSMAGGTIIYLWRCFGCSY